MKKILNFVAVTMIGLYAMLALPVLVPSVVSAADNKAAVCEGVDAVGGGNACDNGQAGNALSGFIKKIINILLFILGSIAVLVIVIGGIRYVLSAGDGNATKGAKDTILYAVVGLVVAVMAYAIVNFVLSSL